MMKKILLIIALSILLSACTEETPVFTEKKPFIVDSFKSYDNDYNEYKGFMGVRSFLGSGYSSIIAPKGFYIGDTIKLDLSKLAKNNNL